MKLRSKLFLAQMPLGIALAAVALAVWHVGRRAPKAAAAS